MARVGPFAVGAVFFDLFGTLLSLEPLADACARIVPDRGAEIAAQWRARQLEASWLRTVMDRWVDFDEVTREALLATLEALGIDAPADVDEAADAFVSLPLRSGAGEAVAALRELGLRTGILTNASSRTLARVAARLELPMDDLLSVDSVRRYKPHRSVYQLAVEATGLPPSQIGFVTANGWDAAGAGVFGLRVAWLRPSATATLPAVGAPEPIVATWPEIPKIFRPQVARSISHGG
jgi:2-haloacid dehalogenase